MTPIQIAPESAKATITAQVSSESPRDDVGDFRATLLVPSFFSVTMLAPLFPAVANLRRKNKKPAQQLWLSAGLKSVYRITELFGSHPAPIVALTTIQRALIGAGAAIHSEILL
jgi:hypothetical protein